MGAGCGRRCVHGERRQRRGCSTNRKTSSIVSHEFTCSSVRRRGSLASFFDIYSRKQCCGDSFSISPSAFFEGWLRLHPCTGCAAEENHLYHETRGSCTDVVPQFIVLCPFFPFTIERPVALALQVQHRPQSHPCSLQPHPFAMSAVQAILACLLWSEACFP